MTDLACVEEASRDPRIPEGTTVPAPYSTEAGQAFIQRQWQRLNERQGVSLAICEPTSDESVGLVSLLFTRQRQTASLGYWVIPRARGQGLASRAVRLLVEWALREAGLARVEAFVEPRKHLAHPTAAEAVLDAIGPDVPGTFFGGAQVVVLGSLAQRAGYPVGWWEESRRVAWRHQRVA